MKLLKFIHSNWTDDRFWAAVALVASILMFLFQFMSLVTVAAIGMCLLTGARMGRKIAALVFGGVFGFFAMYSTWGVALALGIIITAVIGLLLATVIPEKTQDAPASGDN